MHHVPEAHPKRRLIVAEEAVAAAEAEPEAAVVAVAQGGGALADDEEDDIPLPVAPSTEVCGTKTKGEDSEETKRAIAFSDVCDLIKKSREIPPTALMIH
jgi:hypothetical protein